MKKIRFSGSARHLLARRMFTLMAAAPIIQLMPTAGLAQSAPPSAGSMFEANRPQLSPVERAPAMPQSRVRIEKESEPGDETQAPAGDVRVHVAGFRLSGNQSLPDARLQTELAGLVGQELDFRGLREAAARITALYRAEGYPVARAYLPAQEIAGGMVQIGVREGVIGAVSAQTDPHTRLGRDTLQHFIDALTPGSVIREADLERVLLRLSDINGVSVRAVLRPSAQAGAADIVLMLSETTAWTARAAFDNYGNYYTGANRLSATLGLNDALGLGESFTLNTQNSFEGLRIAGLGYAMPIGATGVSIGANFAELQYNVGKNLKDAQASGSAKVSTFFLNSSLLRSRNANINLGLAAEYRHFQDITSATVVDKSSNFWSASLAGDWRDNFLGGGGNLWSIRAGRGTLDKETPNDAALDAITSRAAGNYKKVNLGFSRLQQLGNGYALLGSVSAQWADKNLDASEKMSLGGPNGVRAYPVGEAAGDQGVLARLELRKRLGMIGGAVAEGVLFGDAGRVTVNKTPWDNSPNRLSRSGYGVGLNLYHKDIVMNAAFAVSPGVDPATEQRNARRVWVSVSGSPQAFAGLASDLRSKGEDFEEPETAFVLYGSLGLIPEYVNRYGATPQAPADQSRLATPNGRNMNSFWRARDNVSYIGAHSGIELYQQWKFLWQLELGLSLNYTNRSDPSVPDWSHSQDMRNTGVALNNPAYGTLMYGNWDTPMKESMTSLDPFQGRTSAAHYNLIGSPGFVTSITKNSGPVGTASSSNNDDAAFNRRQAGMFAYWTPKWNGLQAKLAFSDNSMKAAADVNTGYMYSGSLSWEYGGLTAIVAAEQHINYFGIASLGRNARGVGSNTAVTAGTSSSDFSLRYGLGYDFGATKVSLIADDLSYSEYGVINTSTTSTDLSNYRRRAYMLGLSHKIGAWTLLANAGRALPGECSMISGNNVKCSTDGMGASQQAYGFSYAWSRQTRIFGQYTVLRNNALANYNYAVAGVLGASGLSSGVGTTIRAIGLGINYTF
ncbi:MULTISPECIES: ShlB/FhaC/HecB family hemolysin secretion/activation protein [unclassified Herbaspirillum]|uniref:ShlB/FhaC/HecB family hemolysin secretion/activation protein n=1 Tax=unclassified Herbaspirillum TaxID=2624150 RepID=UPI00115000C3|nr:MULTISPECIES: ShlB/FhaC/HecB family hemolysin secretion/activation protein [unclassified Herbaspirillum]MBB5393216.1 hemolysin activation/secretion protein [Herbaspirillum sp. SJZ102]TQK04145.1 hemolysin activation/secretion protein [Herbaspirillum sp. SJZ130]TQK10070.1 hemolysin activation/secretion protein [Herbaspirillum sp. SJZ106]